MNIEQAKCIPMSVILEKLNCKPVKSDNNNIWYLSPLRAENTASFNISKNQNVWFDFGSGEGGDTIKFVCSYLNSTNESDTVVDALRWLKNMVGEDFQAKPLPKFESIERKPRSSLKLVSKGEIKHFGLKLYIKERGIDLEVAKKYLSEIVVSNSSAEKNTTIYALGFKNVDGGYELRNKYFQGSIGKKDISFIRGESINSKGLNIFEGMFDFLSVVNVLNGKPLKNDTIVLNSTSMFCNAIPYITDYGYSVVYSWLDNDEAGKKTKKQLDDYCKLQNGLKHKSMQGLYSKYNDVNDCHKALSFKLTK